MGVAFLAGLVFLLNNNTRKKGLLFAGIPSSIFLVCLLISLFSELFTSKPQIKDLKGTYHIVKVTGINFDKNTYDKYKLQFFENGSFALTTTPYIDICQNGKYSIDYEFDNNELSFDCTNLVTFAHIDRGFGNYRIEFVIGDPDSGESIYFEKVASEL